MLQIPVFSEDYRVITPDSRGLGDSEKTPSGYEVKTLSDDVEGLLDKLGIERAFIVGNSLGGVVAERFTIDHPERVQATIWIGAPTFQYGELVVDAGPWKDRPFAEAYLGALKTKGYLHFWETVWKPTMPNQFHESFVKTNIGSYLVSYLFEERYARLNRDPRGVIQVLEGLLKEECLDGYLAKSRVPAAIICGDGDDTRPWCERQHRAIPDAEYLVIKNSGHFCYLDQPGTFNGFMAEFLQRTSA